MAMSLISKLQYKGQLNKRKRKLKNKGFSLIEVLVAIAILAVLSLPILSAFMSAAQVNLQARREENANAVAQKVMEDMKAKTIEQVMNEVEDDSDRSYTSDYQSENGFFKYVFNMDDYDASGKTYSNKSTGDQFFVRVTLDPSEFSDRIDGGSAVGNTSNNINSFNMPSFTQLQSNENFAITKQVYEHDDEAAVALGVDKSKIYRQVDVYVDVTDKNAAGQLNEEGAYIKYTQTVKIKVTYKVFGSTDTKVYETLIGTHEIIGNMEESKYRSVYLFYNPYDKYRTLADGSDIGISRDIVNFHVSGDDSSMFNATHDYADSSKLISKKMINLYLVQQTVTNVNSPATKVELQNSNINVYEKNLVGSILSTNKSMGIGSRGNINLLTNVAGWKTTDTYNKVNNSITQNVGADSAIKYLYNMKVEVWVNERPGANEPFWTINSTKENVNE